LDVRGHRLNLTITGRNLVLRRQEHPQITATTIAVPSVAPIQVENYLNQRSDWQSAMRKMTVVCNPSLFMKETLVPESLKVTLLNRYSANPTKAETKPQYGLANFTSSAFQFKLNEQYVNVLGLNKEIGKSQEALIQYSANAHRLDTLTVDHEGQLKLELGMPTDLAPVPPRIPKDESPLVNILAESGDMKLTTADIFPRIAPTANDLSKDLEHERQENGCLRHVCQKLRTGKPLRIIFYGDSITCGGSIENPKSAFYNLFTEDLKKRYSHSTVIAINKGLGGTATNTRVPEFDKEILSEHPDLLVVEFVNNFGLAKEDTERHYETILTKSKSHSIDVILCTPHLLAPDYFPKSYGIKSWEMVAKHSYVDQIRGLAKRYHTGLADIAWRWEHLQVEGLAPALLLTDKKLHINERGHEMYAEELQKCLETEMACASVADYGANEQTSKPGTR
jgi:lysophospholipase L1-like esterase